MEDLGRGSLEKPASVLHGSPRGDIKEFIPRVSLGSGEAFGPQVYASNDPAVAAMFTADVDGPWSTGSVGEVLYAIIPGTRESFVERDRGGYIYELPGGTFSSDPRRGMGKREWASPVAVTPTKVTKVPSSLNAMVEAGVQVYFVPAELYEKMRATDSPNWKFLIGLESENLRRGVNVRELREPEE
jgi:hypothetical protein